jgi:hypothetical protein
MQHVEQELLTFRSTWVHPRHLVGVRKGSNKITELRTILQRESKNS